jgi:hypothetical protein
LIVDKWKLMLYVLFQGFSELHSQISYVLIN